MRSNRDGQRYFRGNTEMTVSSLVGAAVRFLPGTTSALGQKAAALLSLTHALIRSRSFTLKLNKERPAHFYYQ
jgi:uncharacterized membrane protein YccC